MSDLEQELAKLNRLLAARHGKKGYTRNVEHIRQRIAALENGQTPAIGEDSDAAETGQVA